MKCKFKIGDRVSYAGGEIVECHIDRYYIGPCEYYVIRTSDDKTITRELNEIELIQPDVRGDANTCSTCRYFFATTDTCGQCRRHAPSWVGFIPTKTGDWCGEFEAVKQ